MICIKALKKPFKVNESTLDIMAQGISSVIQTH
jgi:hypothetical protein